MKKKKQIKGENCLDNTFYHIILNSRTILFWWVHGFKFRYTHTHTFCISWVLFRPKKFSSEPKEGNEYIRMWVVLSYNQCLKLTDELIYSLKVPAPGTAWLRFRHQHCGEMASVHNFKNNSIEINTQKPHWHGSPHIEF